tara:strand:- start:172 stop:333 length:162 start_codon:yes stop_codon:yes gene_type:complete
MAKNKANVFFAEFYASGTNFLGLEGKDLNLIIEMSLEKMCSDKKKFTSISFKI